MRTRRPAVLCLLAATIVLTAGCGTGSAAPASVTTVTQTAAPAFAWPTTPASSTGGIGSAPDFPTALEGWRQDKTWNFTTRAFEGQWSPGTWGNNWSPWQATMNGCGDSMVLLRWRAVDAGAPVVAGWATSGHDAQSTPAATTGWMALDQCQTPRWRLDRDFDGANLADVTIEAQVWMPAP